MAPARAEHVFPIRTRLWIRLLLALCFLYGLWFTVVLIGEQRAWTDDPGAWAGLPTLTWALIGVGLFVVAAAYCLLLLIRRDVPAKVYRVPDAADATPTAPTDSLGTEREKPPAQG